MIPSNYLSEYLKFKIGISNEHFQRFSKPLLILIDLRFGPGCSAFLNEKSVEEHDAAYSSYIHTLFEVGLLGLGDLSNGEWSRSLLLESPLFIVLNLFPLSSFRSYSLKIKYFNRVYKISLYIFFIHYWYMFYYILLNFYLINMNSLSWNLL